METAVAVRDEVGRKHAVPLSILLDLGRLEVEARKKILRALKDSHAREMRLRAEVQRLREQTKRERADDIPLGCPPDQSLGIGLHAKESEPERSVW